MALQEHAPHHAPPLPLRATLRLAVVDSETLVVEQRIVQS